MKYFTLLLFLITPLYSEDAQNYMVKMATVPGETENDISKLYELAISKRKDEMIESFSVSVKNIKIKNDEYYIIEHAYYISQNEIRGFSFAIPLNSVSINGEILTVKQTQVNEIKFRQGLKIIVLK